MDNETTTKLQHRVAGLEAGLRDEAEAMAAMIEADPSLTPRSWCRDHHSRAEDALSGGTAALDAVVARAVEAERARIVKAVEGLDAVIVKVPDATGIHGREDVVWPVEMWSSDDVLAAIEGGACKDEVVAVVLWDPADVAKAKAFIDTLPGAWRDLFAIIPAVTNGGSTVVMGSDGSNEGWDTSDTGDEHRAAFIALCSSLGGRGVHVTMPEDSRSRIEEVPSKYADDREWMRPEGGAS